MTSQKFISIKDVEHVATLARIAISEEEKKRYQEQLERILAHIAQLKEKNTDGIKPLAHPYDVSNVWREDEAGPFPAIPDLFRNAPEMEGPFYKVKKVIE